MIRKLILLAAIVALPLSLDAQVTFKAYKFNDLSIGGGAKFDKTNRAGVRQQLHGLIAAPETAAQANFADGETISGAPYLFSSAAAFVSGDAGKTVVGTGIASTDTTISSVPTTTIAAGSNGAALPQATINVASTTGFRSGGGKFTVTISGTPTTVTYTGLTGTTFTGCTGGTGTLATSQAVGGQVVLSANDTATSSSPINFTIGGRSTTVTLDAAKGDRYFTTLSGNRAVTIKGHGAGAPTVVWFVKQDGTGSRTVTWPNDVAWVGGSAPTLTTTANKVDMITCEDSGVNWLCRSSLNY